jgi:hypothetical protein
MLFSVNFVERNSNGRSEGTDHQQSLTSANNCNRPKVLAWPPLVYKVSVAGHGPKSFDSAHGSFVLIIYERVL